MATGGARCSNPGLSDRMSRSELALLPCLTSTASQVLTADTKITNAEANNFNFFDGADLQLAAGTLLLTAWHRCQDFHCADRGWNL